MKKLSYYLFLIGICLIVVYFSMLQYKRSTIEVKRTTVQLLTNAKPDSTFIRYDSLDSRCIGIDYDFYFDTVRINVITATISPFKHQADTEIFIHGKSGCLLYYGEELDKELLKKLVNGKNRGRK